jgi:hypothetical protein
VLPPGDHGFDSLTIDKDATLLIQGPAVIACGDFTGGKDARLRIDATNGPVTFFVQGTYTHLNGFESVAAPGSPMALAFMISAPQSIVFPSRANLRGGYHAPSSDLTFTSDNEAWGAFSAKRLTMSSGMHFHYDESLSEYWAKDGQQRDPLDVLAWHNVAVQPASLLRDRRDPYVVLGVNRTALLSPALSWDI